MRRPTLVAVLAALILSAPLTAATKYNLTSNERAVVIDFLYEPFGYLDACVDNTGTSARQALAINPLLDVTLWILTSTKGDGTFQGDWNDCAMFWWILVNDNVQVLVQPQNSAAWDAVLAAYEASIASAFQRASLLQRNSGCTTELTAVNGSTSTMPCGTQLQTQQNLYGKVQGVLQ
jgi:hypothetical protein